MADPQGFEELQDELFNAHQKKAFDEGLRLSRVISERFPQRRARATYYEACFRSLLGHPEEALTLLRFSLDERMWWAPDWLRNDRDLDAARVLPGWKDVLAESVHRARDSNMKERTPDVVVRVPSGDPPFPLLVVLHVNRETAAEREAWWFPIAEHGVAVALVGSTLAASSDPDDYWWSDWDANAGHVGRGIAEATEEIGLVQGLILAGFSLNGRVAAQLSLGGQPVPADAFVAIGPSPFDPTDVMARDARVRAWVLVGSDDALREQTLELRDRLSALGLAVRYDEIAGIGHEVPDDLADRFGVRLPFLLGLEDA